MGLELAFGGLPGEQQGHGWAPCRVPGTILPVGRGARCTQPVGLGEAGRLKAGCGHRGGGHPFSLVFGGPTGRWEEGWVMPKAQDTLRGEQPSQAVPKK